MSNNHPTDKTNENLSPEKLNSPRQRRKITKEGPPSRAELEERKRMLDEYKRAREEKRRYGDVLFRSVIKRVGRQELAKRHGNVLVLKTELSESVSMESTAEGTGAESVESIELLSDPANTCMDDVKEREADNDAHEDIAMIVDGGADGVESSETVTEFINGPGTEEMKIDADEDTAQPAVEEPAQPIVEETAQPAVEETVKPDSNQQQCEDQPQQNEIVEAPSAVPKWRGDEGFWLCNRVVIEFFDSKTEAMIIEPVPKPHLRLFKLSQIETQLACGHKELASAMLSILCAPGQKKGNDPMLRARVAARIEKIRARFAAEESSEMLMEPEVTLPFPKPGHFSGSDSEQDETGSKLAMDVEEASRRHSIILSDLCVTPRSNHTGDFRSVQKAARFLAEDEELMASVKKRLYDTTDVPATETKPCKTRRVEVDLAGDDPDEEAGSTVKYALLTPSKRIQEMLHTDLVLSPVRRSVRNFDDDEQVKLYDGIEQVDMTDVGYMPNRSIPGSPYKKTPKKPQN